MLNVKNLSLLLSIFSMIFLGVILHNLNLEWKLLNKQSVEQKYDIDPPSQIDLVADLNTQSEKINELEFRILNIEMAFIAFSYINLLVVIIYLIKNYQNMLDRWRKYKGVEFKPLLAVSENEKK